MAHIINLIPFGIFAIILYLNYRIVRRKVALSNLVVLLYCISTFCYYLLWNFINRSYHYSVESLALIVLSVLFIVAPITKAEAVNTRSILILNPYKVKRLVHILIAIGLYAMVFFGRFLPQVFAMGAVAMRTEMQGIRFYESSAWSQLASLGAFSFVISLYIYFYNKIHQCLSKKESTLLIFSSFSYIVCTLNTAGRDGIVIWILSYVAIYCFFYKYFDKTNRRKLIRPFVYAVFIILPLFYIISTDRFDDSDHGTYWSIIAYTGDSLENLTHQLEIFHFTNVGNQNPLANFELLRQMGASLGLTNIGQIDVFGNMQNAAMYGYRSNQFSFFIGSLYPYNMSFLWYIVFVVCIHFVCRYSLRVVNNTLVTHRAIVAVAWAMIPVVGIFYFYYGSLIGNVALIIPFIIAIYLRPRQH